MEQLLVGYSYDVKDTCAADGMCQEKCPVGINTGALVKVLRDNDEEITDKTHATAQLLASKFQYVALLARLALV